MIKHLNLISDVTLSPFQTVLEIVRSLAELTTVYNQTFRLSVEKKHYHVIYIYFVLYSFQQRDICNYHYIIRVQLYIKHTQLSTY